MGGRGSTSRMSTSLNALGLKVETEIDESRFNFFDSRYGSYARQLARESNEYGFDNLVVSYSRGNNIAYASMDTESDTLEGLMSTGGKTGTDLLVKVMQYQEGRKRGLMWMADHPESIKFYDRLGLGKFGKGNSRKKVYELKPSDVSKAISSIRRRQ